jgi:hypothetical protein
MRSKPRINAISLIVSLAVVLALIASRHTRVREPVYQGRSLSSWLSRTQLPDESKAEEARQAVLQIGTNAIPILIEWLGTDPGRSYKQVLNLTSHLPLPLKSRIRSSFSTGYKYNFLPLCGFGILRERSAPAIPQLVAKMKDASHQVVSLRAALCLVSIGPEALNALLQIASDPNHPMRVFVIASLPEVVGVPDDEVSDPGFAARASLAVTSLKAILADPNPTVRNTASNALHEISTELLNQPAEK